MMIQYTAVDREGRRIQETLETESLDDARRQLSRKGLLVLELAAASQLGQAVMSRRGNSKARNATAPELLMFSRQMTMMLNAGAALVPAMQAVLEQPGRPAWHNLLSDLIERVEGGAPLNEAMARFPEYFPGNIRSMVSGGESTSELPAAFQRVATLLENRIRLRKRIVGAVAYPAMLLVLAVSVFCTMALFVLPRFASLFEVLNAPLPAMTRLLLDTTMALRQYWIVVLAVPIGLAIVLVTWSRTPAGKCTIDRLLLRSPGIGPVVSAVLLTRILQLWGALLKSRVPLLATIRQARDVSRNEVIHQLVNEVDIAVQDGRSISSVFRRYAFVPAPVIASISTGEESGRLGESMEYVGNWLEEESNDRIHSVTKTLEPMILIGMGLVIGSVCLALFLPLFDLATAA